MSLREYRTQLRGATARADSPALVELLTSSPWPKDALQLVGDAILVVVASDANDAVALTRRCMAALEERGWEGDAELAAALASAGNDGPMPMLRPVPVDLEDLASVLEGDPVHGGGRVDLRTGGVWPEFVVDDVDDDDEEEDDDEDDSRWLWVDPQGSRAGHRDMELFIGTVDDPALADRLTIAVAGRGAFRRFKDVIAAEPAAAERWYTLSEDRLRGRARSWLAARGYRPTRPASPDR
ncbi:UPF0158 family protein [Knoellia aerolata]|uniref:Uncharacterized protein n=1 Tax=Knoellia aerolata DSM 18566 TaxID=1385519 RepID=A0A0A0JTM7_9MICO|nr:UPF0158 family protein [Knoellia aerolata]KGN40795.1 hypothetical protein N801_12275 [Knoellia aerolata DSM 18566]